MPIQFVQQFEADFCVATLGAGRVSGQRVVLPECALVGFLMNFVED